jgi:pimeloyl-ACP methyl ester carboxylesterase
MRTRRAHRLLAAGAVVVAAVTSLAAVSPAAAGVSRIHWQPCGDGFECAGLPVPLDYRDPGGTKITVGLIRMPAKHPDKRRGSVVVNGGVQAGGGVDLLRARGKAMFGAVNEEFDIVGFDNRATGASDPLVKCTTFEDDRRHEQPVAAFNKVADRPRLMRESQLTVESCQRRSPALLPHLSSTTVVRDLESLRIALGERQLRFVGLSYGTVIGQMYAARHPDKVRAMVLDAPIDLDGYVRDVFRFDRAQMVATETTLSTFFDWCQANPQLCPFSGGDPRAAFDQLLRRLEQNRIDNPGRHDVLTGGLLLQFTVGYMIDPASWPAYAGLLAGAAAQPLPTVPLRNGENLGVAAYLSQACLDREVPRSLMAYDAHFIIASRMAPYLGPLYGYGQLKCKLWPAQPAEHDSGPWTYRGSAPVLVVGGTDDPLAPYDQTRAIARELGNARLLTVTASGHMSEGRGASCVDGAVAAYLTTGALPPANTPCRIPLPGASR